MGARGRTAVSTLIKSRFSTPIWCEIPKVCEGARFHIRPLSQGKFMEMLQKHGVCTACGGRMYMNDEQGRPWPCPVCAGKKEMSVLSKELKLSVVRWAVSGWENFFGVNPETGENEDIEFCEEYRDNIAESPYYLDIFEKARNLADGVTEEEEKN